MLMKEELKNIKLLQQICEEEGQLQLKLNFDMLESRSENRKEDFFIMRMATLLVSLEAIISVIK
ncbi:hypothetical protein [Neobacillus niacini]|uniref:hypothetical protein n=1 Tax=Neobacillus niacini TaxID=86668 RepID=UPI002FFE1831